MTLPVLASTKSRASARAGAMPATAPARTAPTVEASAQARDKFCKRGTMCGPVSRFEDLERYQSDDNDFYPIVPAKAKAPSRIAPSSARHGEYTVQRASKMLKKAPKIRQRRV